MFRSVEDLAKAVIALTPHVIELIAAVRELIEEIRKARGDAPPNV